MNTTSRILGEAKRKVRPPTKGELTSSYQAYEYARDVIGGRFPEGEAVIALQPFTAFLYASKVIKGRFPEAEATIATNPHQAELYLKAFPEAKLEWVMNGWLDWLDL
jgi:hypothetical protein